METSIDNQLALASEALFRFNKNTKQLAKLNDKLLVAKFDAEKAKGMFDSEAADVEKLEKLTLTAIYYSILGSKEQQLETERQEKLIAFQAYEIAKNETILLEKQLITLKNEQATLADAPQNFERLIAEKDALIKQQNPEKAAEIKQIDNQILVSKNQYREVLEAIEAGKKADNLILEMITALSSARSWGQWDLAGGGMIASGLKHNKINKARILTHKIKNALFQLQVELGDIHHIDFGKAFELDNFTVFADYFFDNIFTDWFVQQRIHHSLDAVKKVQFQLVNVFTALLSSKKQLETDILTKEEQRHSMIMES